MAAPAAVVWPPQAVRPPTLTAVPKTCDEDAFDPGSFHGDDLRGSDLGALIVPRGSAGRVLSPRYRCVSFHVIGVARCEAHQ